MSTAPSKNRALLVGLTHVDPNCYYGWDGRNGCHGCGKDVANMATLLTNIGWETHTLLDADATCLNLRTKLQHLAKETNSGDALLFYFSGHGGQIADDDGDELDEKDETLICYDGPLRDDTLNAIWLSCGHSQRIYMLADCCNSGTNYKNLPDDETIPLAPPIKLAADLRFSEDSMRSRLLHLGGCRDGLTSIGLRDGGVFTLSLIRRLSENPELTWRELYNLICRDVTETQDPSINLYPNVGNNLDTEPALRPPAIPISTDVPPTSETSIVPAQFTTSQLHPIAMTLSESILPRIDAREAARVGQPVARSNGPRLVAEGDSWFDFPLHPDVIDCLSDRHGYNIVNASKAGACVYEMAYGPDDDFFDRDDSQLEDFVKKIRRHRPQGLLLSGGGNDFVGPEFIMTIHHAAAKKSGPNMALVNALFQQDLEPAFERIIATAIHAGQQAGLGTLPIFTHGYDYAMATGDAAINLLIKKVGPWMDPSFRAKGYPKARGAELTRRIDIVRPMIDALYTMLERLRSRYPTLHIVNVRNILTNRSDWHDELHPTREGFLKVAALFDAKIRSVLGNSRSLTTTVPGIDTAQDIQTVTDQGTPLEAPIPATPLSVLSAEQLCTLAETRRIRESIVPSVDSDPTELLDLLTAARHAMHDDLTGTVPLPADIAASEDRSFLEIQEQLQESLRLPTAKDEGDVTRTSSSRTRPTFEQRRAHYDALFTSCRIRAEHVGTVAWYLRKLRDGESRYRAVGSRLNIPWEFIGIIHGLECSFNFNQHLHNGDPLTRRTSRVPTGRPAAGDPPFTWEESAIDALMMKNYHQQTDWSVAAMIYRFENYNGWGYYYRSLNSPYLWSFSQHYTRGKFVRDGVYDPNAVSRQCGAAVMLKALRSGTRSLNDNSPLITLAGGADENDPASYIETLDLSILDLTEENEPMDDAPEDARPFHDPDASSWTLYPEFEAYIRSLRLRYFSPAEFLVKGNSHYSGNCAGRNTHPPRHLWANMGATARVVDELRHRLGYPIRFLSAYRSPAYNQCISGAGGSMHMTYKAIDLTCSQGTPAQWATALRALRSSGQFRGGIGTYGSFVHVDTRGTNADW